MSIKPVLLSLFWLLLVSSCKEISYPVPQPSGIPALAKIPDQLQGRFVGIDPDSGEKSDTLIIETSGYHFQDTNDKDWLGKGVLSDSLVIKSYMNYYFVNFRLGNQWVLRLIKPNPSGSIELLSIDLKDDAQVKEVIKKISARTKVKEIKTDGSDVFYQINPTPALLLQFINQGYFTGIELRRQK